MGGFFGLFLFLSFIFVGDSYALVELEEESNPSYYGNASTLQAEDVKRTMEHNAEKSNLNFSALDASKEPKAVVQETAPADTTVDWYDSDQEPGVLVLKRHNGTTWVRASSYGVQYLANCAVITAGMCVDADDGKLYYHNGSSVVEVVTGSGSYTLPPASADTLGGIKVGERLSIADGVLSADVQSGSLPSGTVNGQVLLWITDQWVASTAPWLTTASLGTGVAAALGFAPNTTGGFLLYSTYAADPLVEWDSVTMTEQVDTPTAGTNTIGVKSGVFQAYDVNMITWPSAVSATEVGYLDGVTSSIQAQIDSKQNSLSFTTTGLTAGHPYYMASGGSLTDADADGAGTYPARCVAVSETACKSTGFYTATSHGFTVGSTLWLSTTAGAYTTTQPSTSGNKIQSLGWVVDSNTLFINVSPDYATVQ